MHAIAFTGTDVEFVDVARPIPQGDQVLIEVLAAGVCQTDVHIRRGGYAGIAAGRILGHEIAGQVAELGPAITQWRPGDQVVVYPVWSCGSCPACLVGRRNACVGTGNRRTTPITPGVTADGGMSQFVAVPADALVRTGDLDPRLAATLTDAALSPYGSISAVRDTLTPGTSAIVIGVGGLGSMAVQILRATTSARVIAVDVDEAALRQVSGYAHHVLRNDDPAAVEQLLALTGGYGAQAVFDFVGIDQTLELAADTVAPFGAIRVTGMGGGSLGLLANATSRLPRGATIAPRLYSGTFADLLEVRSLAQSGTLMPTIVSYDFTDAIRALDDLESGRLKGRAVLQLV